MAYANVICLSPQLCRSTSQVAPGELSGSNRVFHVFAFGHALMEFSPAGVPK